MKNKGFTIVELIITMIIIVILGVVVAPSFIDPDYEKKHLALAKTTHFVFCKDVEGEIHQAKGYKIDVEGNVVIVHKSDGTTKMFVNMDCWTEEETTVAPVETNEVRYGS